MPATPWETSIAEELIKATDSFVINFESNNLDLTRRSFDMGCVSGVIEEDIL